MKRMTAIATESIVIGTSVQSILSSVEVELGSEVMKIFKKNGLCKVEVKGWYSLSDLAISLFEIEEIYGAYTLFSIGKMIPESIVVPEGVTSLELFLNVFSDIYKMNHQGDVGSCSIISHDTEKGIVVIESTTPYPCEFERGVFTSFARKLTKVSNVEIDSSKTSRRNGAGRTYYILDYIA